jgi:hypothetical protein
MKNKKKKNAAQISFAEANAKFIEALNELVRQAALEAVQRIIA